MHEERIRRMAEQGVITAMQAEKLLSSVKSGMAKEVAPVIARRQQPFALYIAAGFLILILLAVLGMFLVSGPTEVSNVKDAMHDIGGGGMNKTVLALAAIIIIAVIPLIIWIISNNNLVGKEERVISSWAQVESNYQRRSDLIPVLVESVSRYLKHEKETLTGITESRSQQVKIVQDNLNELIDVNAESAKMRKSMSGQVPTDQAMLEKMNDMEEKIGLGMRRIIAVIEDYPELRSSEQFITLQAQLEGTENRINVARIRFNETVRDYNTAIRRFPGSIVASAGGFTRKVYFQSEAGAEQAKPLNFD